MRHLLVLDEDRTGAGLLAQATLDREDGFHRVHLHWDDLIPERLRACDVDVIVAVVTPDHERTARLLQAVCRCLPGRPVLAVLRGDTDDVRPAGILNLADDFIVEPVRTLELRCRISRLLAAPEHDHDAVCTRLQEEMALTRLIGRDPAFLRAVEPIPRFARFDMSVLITGETGTGKELCARALHHLSRRRDHPFIAVDCGAVPDQLFENELFGHARGAFTDAYRDHKGLVAMANGGTLFLDEIDALSLTAQAKLLRFLQEHSYRPLGSDRYARSDVKVIAATNRDLERCVRDKQLRADLYFRLNVLRIHLPPLRERRGDIPLLACSVLKTCSGPDESAPSCFSPAALRTLTAYGWPGNVRELCNVVQRAVVACRGDKILPAHISLDEAGPPRSTAGDFRAARAAAVAAFERRYVEELLRKHRGNVTHAAAEAQQDRRAFGRFIKKYQIDRTAL